MKSRFLILFLLITPKLFFAQDYSKDWVGYFSYLDIVAISEGEQKMYAAADNAVFIYDLQTKEMEELSTINGLSGESISSLLYVESKSLLFIGFENGLIQVYNETNNQIVTVIDIVNKPVIPPNEKKINHFNFYNDYLYISTDYGISLYNVNALEFGDTYFIGTNGSRVKVNQTTVFNDYIYAATESKIYRALVDNTNLIDYQQWESFFNTNVLGIQAVGNKLYAGATNKKVYEIINTTATEKQTFTHSIVSFKSLQNKLIISTTEEVHVFSEDFSTSESLTTSEDLNTDFTFATLGSNNEVFIGTKGDFNSGRLGLGLIKTTFSNPTDFIEIHPECPLSNNMFSIKAKSDNIWASYGDYTLYYNAYPVRKRGFSHFKNEKWVNMPYDSLLGARNLNVIAVNPLNTNEVFVNSFFDGLLEIRNDNPTTLYGVDNSSFESINSNGTDIRNGASIIDKDGVLWCVNSRILSGEYLKSFDYVNGVWGSYDFGPLLSNPVNLDDEFGFESIDIDDNGVKWMGGYLLGIVGFNTESGEIKSISEETLNMPTSIVRAVAVDKNNSVWIGTERGLRVIYNTSEFFSNDDFAPSEIIILEDDIPSELLFQKFITDIKVDGSNNKWISTLDSGVYYFSADGQETIYHFTTDNSPLPTNQVVQVSIDGEEGKVFFATPKGLVSFRSDTSPTSIVLEDAYAYPNPVRPTFNIVEDKVKIKGLSDNVNIKITDIEGNLVTEAQSNTNLKFKGYNLEIDGGTALWNGKNLAGRVVASGVYLALISDLTTQETKVLKIMVVR